MLRLIKIGYKRFSYILIVFTLMLSISGCSEKNDFEKYHNSSWGISISYPKKWVVQDTSVENKLNVMFSKEEFNYSKANEAVVSLMGIKGNGGTDFVNQMEESVKSNKQIIEEKDITLNKIKAKKIIVSETEESDKGYSINYIFIKQGEKNCVILYSAKVDNAEYLKIIGNMINTLKFE